MDIDKLRQFVLQPEESAKLDFKIELYKINEPKPTVPADIQRWTEAKQQQWAELTKDILALANGNIGTATQIGYLIIGADDKLKPDGTQNLRDVGSTVPTRKEILDKVNSYCQIQLPDIQCEKILLDGINLFIISIPRSPYLHRLSKQLKTPKKEYSPHTVLIRRGDGERTYEASSDEQKAIEQEKQAVRFDFVKNHRQVDHQEQRGQRLSPEVYERKIKTYRNIRNFLDLILLDATITREQLVQFILDTDEAIFMFDREVSDYLQTLYKNAAKLYSTNKRLANSNLPTGEERLKLEEENSERLIWFTEQIEIVRNLFYKHISL